MTALILAAHHGDVDQVKTLIAKLGSDVNFIDEVSACCLPSLKVLSCGRKYRSKNHGQQLKFNLIR